MQIIANNQSGQYVALVTKSELMLLSLGNTSAEYRTDLKDQAREILKKADNGALNFDICNRANTAFEFISEKIGSDESGTIVYKLKSIIKQLETLERLKNELTELPITSKQDG